MLKPDYFQNVMHCENLTVQLKNSYQRSDGALKQQLGFPPLQEYIEVSFLTVNWDQTGYVLVNFQNAYSAPIRFIYIALNVLKVTSGYFTAGLNITPLALLSAAPC